MGHNSVCFVNVHTVFIDNKGTFEKDNLAIEVNKFVIFFVCFPKILVHDVFSFKLIYSQKKSFKLILS